MMFCGTLYELFCFLLITIIAYCANGDSLIGKNDEHVDNEFRMCLDSFDIHKNKIIRTQDSQEMGAKYLNEIDVNSRDECLRFCCKTSGCDVFIFEEKKPGSCYLFQCGPLHDFKCKFTSHANYTSAVRTTYNTQEEELRISQQEHELKSLRKLTDGRSEYTSLTVSPVKTIVTQTPKILPTTPMPAKPAGCSRNQYECRSSGECIAIYNVCDGIPQCTDGSDEAAELVCPTEKPTVAAPIVVQNPVIPQLSTDVIKYQQLLSQRKPIPPLYPHEIEGNLHPWDLTNPVHQMIPQQQNLMYPAQQIQVPQLHKNFGPQDYHWDYQPLYERNKENYKIPAPFRDPTNINTYDREQPPILTRQEVAAVEPNEPINPAGGYPNSNHPPHFALQNAAVWQKNQLQQQQPSVEAPSTQEKKSNLQPEHIKTTSAPPCDDDPLPKTKEPEKPHNVVNKGPSQEKTNSQELDNKSSITNSKQTHIQSNNSKGHKNKAVNIEDHTREHHRATIVEHLRQVNEEDNLRPKGAVVSLALGLTVTAITAALIACRLRVVRRRGRRGHGPYAHDADYLVNGMYL